MYEKTPVSFNLLNQISLNLKIKTEGQEAPLKIRISYPGAPAQKFVHVFTSFDAKEPGPTMFEEQFLNPELV